jgi:hypothetical protein
MLHGHQLICISCCTMCACIIHQQLMHACWIAGFFTKCYHINRGNLLQYKLIYSSRIYIALKKVPEYQYPLYFENSKFELIACIIIHHASADACMLNRRMFTKCYHINRGNLLQYKLIYSSRINIALKKVPEYQYPLYFKNSKFDLILHAWCHSWCNNSTKKCQ